MKSPGRRPATHAGPLESTDSKYCTAGHVGHGVNSEIGPSATTGIYRTVIYFDGIKLYLLLHVAQSQSHLDHVLIIGGIFNKLTTTIFTNFDFSGFVGNFLSFFHVNIARFKS